MNDKQKRTHAYCMPPASFGISSCSCGNQNTQWSEWQKYLWCENCQKDFIPEQNGVFDGPILVNVCELLGIYFDRINLETGEIEPGTEGGPVHFEARK